MSTNVIMPQMGESIAEGTLTKWLKKAGDSVKRDEPLFEISTDKVDAEIPSPSAGVLLEILVEEGKTVPINTVVGRLGAAGETAAAAPAAAPAPPPAPPPAKTAAEPVATVATAQPAAAAPPPAAPAPAPAAVPASLPPQPGESREDLQKRRSSPVVRNIAAARGVDIGQVSGSGISGRVTKADILTYLEQTVTAPSAVVAPASAAAPAPAPAPAAIVSAAPLAVATFAGGANVVVEPMSAMRRKIAQRMVESKHTSAHVTSVFEVDFTPVARLRDRIKDRFLQQYGTKLTYLPFVLKAAISALKARPVLNASISGEDVVYHRDINLGMAVALDWGLIVPVIRNADDLSLVGLARAANDLANRARSKKLNPDEVTGGTFTVTNHGTYGSLFATPVLNQPQVGILGFGTIEKRAKVVTNTDGSDSIAIKTMAYMSITFDHRLIDGAEGDQFMALVKKTIEETRWTELESSS